MSGNYEIWDVEWGEPCEPDEEQCTACGDTEECWNSTRRWAQPSGYGDPCDYLPEEYPCLLSFNIDEINKHVANADTDALLRTIKASGGKLRLHAAATSIKGFRCSGEEVFHIELPPHVVAKIIANEDREEFVTKRNSG
jgi:hypothetical protein